MRIAIPLFCVLLAACGPSGPPTRGAPVTFAAACDKANEGKRVMLEGYVAFPQTFHGTDTTVMLRVRPAFDSFENIVGASATFGNAANNVEIPPELFKKADLKLHLSDGQVAGYTNKIKVSGTMYYPSSMAQVEFKCGLSNTLYEPESNQ